MLSRCERSDRGDGLACAEAEIHQQTDGECPALEGERTESIRPRLLVAVDGIGNSEALVRAAQRLAEGRRAPWTVAFVDLGATGPAQRARVERAFLLAERLGGDTVSLRGTDPVAEILAFSRARGITTLVLGRSRRRPLAVLIGRTLSQRLLREGGELEITFVPSRARGGPVALAKDRVLWQARDYLIAIGAVAFTLALALLVHPWLPLANLSPLFLAGVLWAAVRTGTGPALLAAGLSALAYDFFLEPRYFLVVHDASGLLTIGFFLFMVVVGGQLAGRLRRQLQALRATNAQTQGLLDLSRRLAPLTETASVQRETVAALARHLRLPTLLLAPGETDDRLSLIAASDPRLELDAHVLEAVAWCYSQRQHCGIQSQKWAELPWRLIPLLQEPACFGVIGIGYAGKPPPTAIELAALDVLVGQATLAMARTCLTDRLEQARLGEETERLRSALLSSVSHDLRTPLASIIGAASSLRTLGDQLSAQDREELLDALLSEGERLDRYIQNLLDMTRLGHSTLTLQRDWVGIDDLIGSAQRRLRELLRGLTVVRRIDPDLPLLHVQPALMEQALVNVLDNAAKFSPPGGAIEIAVRRDGSDLLLRVCDQGAGIPAAERERVFDMFFTGDGGDRDTQGSGLGLAICAAIASAHGGGVTAEPGADGQGTCIALRLPLQAEPDHRAPPA
ncbi:ATP-binding protein [Thiocystis violacea]|uniref:ATP-binding protein n=1 Tax=Thiocystis violacea TaxID=13725 RepID=UPI001903FE3D|nr:ATP-binding protein [Thiocystis violacea]